MKMINLKSEKGFALISVYMAAIIILAISGTTFTRALVESREVTRELNRLQIRSNAEAGLQTALAQIGFNALTGGNAYTGYINTANINQSTFTSAIGSTNIGSFSANINYPNQADWVTVTATGTYGADQDPITLEARVFLDSNFSKYMVYANTPTVWLGNNLVLGESDGTNVEGVPQTSADRNMLYYVGDLEFSGSNINIYGDVHSQGEIRGNASSWLHGDAYAGAFSMNGLGQVTNSGVTGGLNVLDGFLDDIDRNADGFINTQDYPDYHDLTSGGGGDAHKFETVSPLDLTFYSTTAQSVPGVNGIDVVRYTGGTSRYIKLEPGTNGATRIVEYSNASYQTQISSQDFNSKNGILYVQGDVYVKGEVQGRVTVVSSDDIFYTGNVKYSGNTSYVTSNDSLAFLAKDKHYFLPENVEVSGIIYGEKGSSGDNIAIDATYKAGDSSNGYAPTYDGGATKWDGHFRHYGNIVMNGTANTSVYQYDRAYQYDPNIKYFRPPGLPIQPVLRLVREAANP